MFSHSKLFLRAVKFEVRRTNTVVAARKWYDFSVVKEKGKAFPTENEIKGAESSSTFPEFHGFDLNDNKILSPPENNDIKIVALSICDYGFTIVRSWLDNYRNLLIDDKVFSSIILYI